MRSLTIPFKGGIITEGAFFGRDPGTCLFATNYEITPAGGYRRFAGYTLFDGSDTPAAPPGVGPIRGGFVFNNICYAVRDDADSGILYKQTATGWDVVHDTFPTGGTYKFYQNNFFATTGKNAVYGVNGVGTAFEFDGTTVTAIPTLATADKPIDLIAWKGFLLLAFADGIFFISEAGDPFGWDPSLGAIEFGIGDDITGFAIESGTVIVAARNKIVILTGTGVLVSAIPDWTVSEHSATNGAITDTLQRNGSRTVYLDDSGLTNMTASDVYGDFAFASFSVGFQPMLMLMAAQGIKCSVVLRRKNQYRLFFGNGTGICCSFNGDEFSGATTFSYPDVMQCVWTGEVNGVETIYGGDTAGNVYQLDSGTSFNGDAIESLLRLQYYHYKSPNQRKRFRRLLFEAEAESGVTLTIAPDFSFSSADIPRSTSQYFTMGNAGGFWDGDNWENFNWSVPLSPSDPVRITGVGVNMSVLIYHTSATASPFTLFAVTVDYDDRSNVR